MLAVELLRGSNGGEESFSNLDELCEEGFLGEISFSDLFMGMDEDGDMLPDLELDPDEIFAEFSVNGGGVVEEEEEEEEEEEDSGSASTERGTADMEAMEYPMEAENEVRCGEQAGSPAASTPSEPRADSAPDEGEKARKTPAAAAAAAAATTTTMAAKGVHGKRKAKVDWTPELHRRFVQAVEQLGIDKAVPSRILELMGIDCLTRHNIASHLQKYRSHRKHLLARGAEAASWSQRRQMYAGSAVVAAKRPDGHPWAAAYPAIGYLPPLPSPLAGPPLRPLHVWGHPPAVDAPRVGTWPRRPPWAANPHPDPSFWQHHCYYYHRGSGEAQWAPHAITKGAPCFPPAASLPTTVANAFTGRFPGAPVPGIVPVSHPIYEAALPNATTKNSSAQPLVDAHPSTESIDAAIGDVLEKPWLPMPLGLKPPSLDSVLLELHKNGVSKVP